jgi:hypothetical protein
MRGIDVSSCQPLSFRCCFRKRQLQLLATCGSSQGQPRIETSPCCLRDGEKVVATVAVMDSMGLTHSPVDLVILP